ncbi:MAG: hypothetical protein AABZ80_07330 [Gemmatimonadota bacterium]
MVSRLFGISLLLGASACATAGNTGARAVLSPQNGPKAQVYASYSGGLTLRTVRTTFKTAQNAHVIVGRLGGDGRVEILYPENPKSSTQVRGGKTYSARSFGTNSDGVPQIYAYASRAPRSYGARVDSYDGRGNGFIFIIAAQYPMFTEVLDDHGFWADSLEVDDYYSSFDPRYAIRDLADELTRGMPYTLDYANSFTSTAFTGYADMAFDCSALSGLSWGFDPYGGYSRYGWMPAYGWWFGSGFDSFTWRSMRPSMFYTSGYSYAGGMSSQHACGLRYAGSHRYADRGWGSGWDGGRIVVFPPTAKPPTPEPTKRVSFSPESRRPGFRNGNESGPAISLTRPRLDGQRSKTSTSTSTWAPPMQGTRTTFDRNSRFDRSNSSRTSSSGSFGSTRTGAMTSGPSGRAATPAAPRPAPPAPAARPSAPTPRAESPAKPRMP